MKRNRTGLAGLFSWVAPALADRDLFFQDLHVLSGWGPCPSWAKSPRAWWTTRAFWGMVRRLFWSREKA